MHTIKPHLSPTGEPRTRHRTPDVVSIKLNQGEKNTSLNLLLRFFQTQPRILLAAFVTRAHCQPMFSFGTPSSFQYSVSPQPVAGYVVILPQVQNLALPFAELHGIPVSLFFQSDQVPLYGSTTLCYIKHCDIPTVSSAL